MTFEYPSEDQFRLEPTLRVPGELGFVEVEPMEAQGPITSYPSDERMNGLYDALDQVIDSYNQEPGLRQAYREELARRFQSSPEGTSIHEIISGISIDDIRGSLL
ncbi:MAG TPA: hypothetical protein VMV24_00775 [Candidatus Dormibacteraeota bacterium]|nr:hypothetical protein [Candidatus Dormibacteraeota bacterium]